MSQPLYRAHLMARKVNGMRKYTELFARLTAIVSMIAFALLLAPGSIPARHPTTCWIQTVDTTLGQSSNPTEIEVRLELHFFGPPPKFDKSALLFRAELLCDDRNAPSAVSDAGMSQKTVLNANEDRLLVTLSLLVDTLPEKANPVAYRISPSVRWIRDKSVAIPLTPARDTRGRPLPIGAIARIENDELKELASNVTIPAVYEHRWKESPAFLYDRGVVSPNGRFVALTDGYLVFLCDLTENSHRMLWNELSPIGAMAFSPDSSMLAVNRREIALWNLQEERFVQPLAGGADRIAFSRDSSQLVAVDENLSRVRRWDAIQGSLLSEKPFPWASRLPPNAIALGPEGGEIVFFDADEVLHLWSTTSGELLRSQQLAPGPPLETSNEWPFALIITPDRKAIVTHVGGRISIWGLDSGVYACLEQFCTHLPNTAPWPLSSSSDGELIAAGDTASRFWLIDANSGRVKFESLTDSQGGIVSTTCLAAGTSNQMLQVWRYRGTLECEAIVWDLNRIRNLIAQTGTSE